MMGGDRVIWNYLVLGRTYPDSALAYARRLSGLTGAPLVPPP